jgi:hypothetical protein
MSLSMPTLFGRATALFKEHSSLRRSLGRLRELAGGRASGDREPAALIEHFMGELHSHFIAEEDDGSFGTLAESCPELAVAVAELRAEHLEMMGILEHLRALALQSGASSDLARGIERLLEQFDAHERRESALMQSFLTSDQNPYVE